MHSIAIAADIMKAPSVISTATIATAIVDTRHNMVNKGNGDNIIGKLSDRLA